MSQFKKKTKFKRIFEIKFINKNIGECYIAKMAFKKSPINSLWITYDLFKCHFFSKNFILKITCAFLSK